MNKTIQTYSRGQAYLNCQMKEYWRNVCNLVPNTRSEAFTFGDLAHQCLERHHGLYTFAWTDIQDLIKHLCVCPDPSNDELVRTYKIREAKAIGMMYGYVAHYPAILKESFHAESLEEVFSGKLINPATGHASKKITFSGKIDGLVQKPDGSYWILEHKTCSRLDEDYIISLWSKIQTQIYAYYIEQARGITIRGTIYNLLQKCGLKHKQGETEEEFRIRYSGLCKKNASGKSSATRKIPEDYDDYTERCIKWHTPDKYHREEVMFDLRLRERMLEYIHQIGQMMLRSARTGVYVANEDCCGRYGAKHPCEYLKLCQAGLNWQNEAIDYYHEEKPNSELRETKAIEQDTETDEMPF